MKIHDKMVQKVAANVRERRERLGLTQRDLAAMLSVTQAYVSLIEQGARTPSLFMLARLADVLKLPLSEILT